jgi:GntR family transcriptional repressor for pyruvate dehydrogenase complex
VKLSDHLTNLPEPILMPMAFQKIATKRKSVHVAEQIAEAIRLNAYQIGDRLPAERVIAEQMGVSRPSVREALSALQLVGVLETRPGDGTYVVKGLDRRQAAITLLEEHESPVDALEARRVLERAIVQIAAMRATPQGLNALTRTLDALRLAARRRDYEAFTAANGPFHLAIVHMAGNELLERAVDPLIDVMQQQLAREMRRREYAPDGALFDDMLSVHVDVYKALADRDAASAADAMDRHFDLIEASLRA